MSANQITEKAAHDMGAQGAPASEHERLLFEAWMRGHCWALCAQWDGTGYRGSAENSDYVCPRAMNTRQLWAAWRDRAALFAQAETAGFVSVAAFNRLQATADSQAARIMGLEAAQATRLSQDADDATRYRWLRSRELTAINAGGVFAGKTPDNVVLNGTDLDAAIDAARAQQEANQ